MTSQRTDNTGKTVFENVRKGEHNLTVSHENYQTKTETITVDENHNVFDVSLIRKVIDMLRIVVHDTDDNPVVNATVKLDDVTRQTGSVGGCTFRDVTVGEHELMISADGYNTFTTLYNVSEEFPEVIFKLTSVDPQKYDVHITVNDTEDNPVVNATVSIDGVTRTTDSVGSCVFSNVTEGSHSLQVSHDFYQTVTETITVDSTHIEFTKSLTRMVASSVVITVNGDNNLPVSDVTVQLNNIYRNTGVNGTCSFPNIPYGVHEILAVIDGYKEYTGEITVKDNQHNFTIRLTPVPRYTIGFMVIERGSGMIVKSIENASVVLDGNTEQTTDSRGMCSFNNIMEGDHHISVTHGDYQTHTDNITVDEDNTGFTVEMIPFPS